MAGLTWTNISDRIMKSIENSTPSIDVGKGIFKSKAEAEAQPFKSNQILTEILSSYMPKWFHYLSLGLIALTLIVSVAALLHSYNLI
jgi:hypothetical protein|tara:strand:+ start:1816 stop:2076 length:261 start_codon:yes stop_codon:yes gene_type:complete